MKKEESGWQLFGTFVICIVMFPYEIIARGFVMQEYWRWFIEPEFGIITPSLIVMVGLSSLIRIALYIPKTKMDDRQSKSFGLIVFTELIGWPFAWVFGWVLTQFM